MFNNWLSRKERREDRRMEGRTGGRKEGKNEGTKKRERKEGRKEDKFTAFSDSHRLHTSPGLISKALASLRNP